MTDKIDQALTELNTTLQPFMPRKQAQILIQNLHRSEEADAFADIILNLAKRIKTMPQVYETDGQGKNALAQLHYFVGSYDAYIVEKDTAEKQIQAFGWASFGYGFECGYISIDELLDLAELDLYFTPCAVAEAFEAYFEKEIVPKIYYKQKEFGSE